MLVPLPWARIETRVQVPVRVVSSGMVTGMAVVGNGVTGTVCGDGVVQPATSIPTMRAPITRITALSFMGNSLSSSLNSISLFNGESPGIL
jgi:hypothetical protein